jgi:hypothetical protein
VFPIPKVHNKSSDSRKKQETECNFKKEAHKAKGSGKGKKMINFTLMISTS